MATRLYPVADQATLEILCGAPAGAWAKMEEINARYNNGLTDELYEAREREFEANHGTSWCYDFDLYGWGRLNYGQYEVIKCLPDVDPYCGSTTDRGTIEAILALIPRDRGGQVAWEHRDKITKLSWN